MAKYRKTYMGILLLAVSAIGLYIRYLGLDCVSGDFRDCLYPWYENIRDAGPGLDALRNYRGDYSMPYIFLIWLLCKIPISFLWALKLVHIVFDMVLAVLAGKIAGELKPDGGVSFCVAYSLVFLHPSVFFNSSYWGQCDVMYTVFLMAAIFCMLRERYAWMMIWVGAGLAFKLQAIFLLPFLLIFYWVERRFSILQFLWIPAAMLLMNIPAMLAGYSPLIAFTQHIGQTGAYPWMYYFYPNIWYFIQVFPYYMFSSGAILLTMAALLLFVVMLVKKRVEIDKDTAIEVILWTAFTCVSLLPSMHERYGYFVEVLAVVWAVHRPKESWFPIGLALCVLPKYLYAVGMLAENTQALQMVTAAANVSIYGVFTGLVWKRMFQKKENQPA